MAMLVTSSILVIANSQQGITKSISAWSVIDILGEGFTALFVLFWMMLVLVTRRPGKTTNWLALGLLGFYLSCWQDFMDEFFKLPSGRIPWDSVVESLPIGLVCLSVGLVFWYLEQRQLETYLRGRHDYFQTVFPLHRESGLPRIEALKHDVCCTTSSDEQSVLIVLKLNDDSHRSIRYFADELIDSLPRHGKAYQIASNHFALLLHGHQAWRQIPLFTLIERLNVAGLTHHVGEYHDLADRITFSQVTLDTAIAPDMFDRLLDSLLKSDRFHSPMTSSWLTA
jgi:hypothetical protein